MSRTARMAGLLGGLGRGLDFLLNIGSPLCKQGKFRVNHAENSDFAVLDLTLARIVNGADCRSPLFTSRGGRDGAIAQLGERVVRNDEVGGSIPPGSTTLRPSGFAWRSRARSRRAKRGARRSPLGRRRATSENSLPRKPRRPLLDKTRHAFAEIAAAQRDAHFAVGVDGGFGQCLERHIVKLPLDHRDRAW